jgi:nitrogenase molybdenum-iron protein alpha/beta subunit
LAITNFNVEPLRKRIEEETKSKTEICKVSGLMGTNPRVGYDTALTLLFDLYRSSPPPQKKGTVNLFGWQWPSRSEDHDIGALVDLLKEFGIGINTILPGGSTLEDIRKSLQAEANVMVCSSYTGNALDTLEKEYGIKTIGERPAYGFTGTNRLLSDLQEILGIDLRYAIDRMMREYRPAFMELKRKLKGKGAFVSGGPGRLMGLLDLLLDYEIDIQYVALYWAHKHSKKNLRYFQENRGLKIREIIIGPSVYELDEIAAGGKIELWLGGYQEHHICKKHSIPFVPTTVYSKSNLAFQGTLNLGRRMVSALQGFDLTQTVFASKEVE